MQSIYAVYGSELHLIFEDDFADAYNRAHEKFIQSTANPQQPSLFRTISGRQLLVELAFTPEELHAFNAFGELMNHIVKVNGGHLELFDHDDNMTSNYLVKL